MSLMFSRDSRSSVLGTKTFGEGFFVLGFEEIQQFICVLFQKQLREASNKRLIHLLFVRWIVHKEINQIHRGQVHWKLLNRTVRDDNPN